MSLWASMLRQSSLYGLAMLAARFSSVLLLPLYTRALRPADYGVLDVVSTAFVLMELLVGIRVGDALLYFYAKALRSERPATESRAVLQSALTGAFLLGMGALAMGLLTSAQLSLLVMGTDQYARLFRIGFIGLCGAMVAEIAVSYCRAVDRPIAYCCYSIGRLLLTIAGNLFFLFGLRWGVEGVMWAGAAGSVLTAAAGTVHLVRKFGWGFVPGRFWDQFKYSFPLSVGGIGVFCVQYGNRYFLARYVALEDVGLFSVANRIGMAVSMAHNPFAVYWNAQMFHVAAGPDGRRVYVRVFRYLSLILIAVAVVVSIFRQPALRVLAAPDYWPAADLVPWLALAFVVRGMAEHLRGLFSLRRRTSEHSIVAAVGVVVALPLFSLMIPRWGVRGAVAAMIGTFLAMLLAALRRAQRLERYDYEWRSVLIVLAFSALVVAGGSYWPPAGFFAQIGAGVAWLALWAAAIWFGGALTQSEREKLAGWVRQWSGR